MSFEKQTNLAADSDRETEWQGITLATTTEDIAGGVEWTINDARHAVIVHVDGKMNELETELDGRGMSFEPANAGEIWIVPAGAKYAAYGNGATIEYGVIFLNPAYISEIFSGQAEFSYISPLHGIRDDYCFHAVRRLSALMDQPDDTSAILAESIQQSIAIHLYQTYGDSSIAERAPVDCRFNEQAVKILRSFIHDNLDKKISIADLVAATNFPPRRFLSAFRKAFGQTPGQYLIAQRLRRAQWLLANSKRDITDIAFATGFSSHSHLATTFRKHLNQTPSEYRKLWH